MNKTRNKRSLKNVKLTGKYHYSHFGLWLLVLGAFIISLNLDVYWFAQSRWASAFAIDEALQDHHKLRSTQLVGVMIIKTILFVLASVLLAKFTSHRVYGPYINLVHAFNAVRDGEIDRKLKFRKYDKLEQVEAAFNAMMDSLRDRLGDGNPTSTALPDSEQCKDRVPARGPATEIQAS